jgi:hypothetical protein
MMGKAIFLGIAIRISHSERRDVRGRKKVSGEKKGVRNLFTSGMMR